MTQRRAPSGGPRALLAPGADWPSNPITNDTVPPTVAAATAAAAAIAARLDKALRGRNIAAVAREADVARSTLYDLTAGTTWPDIITLFKLEDALGTRLWGLK